MTELQEDFDRVLAKLKPHSKMIGEMAVNGDARSTEVIVYYKMFQDCPEPMSLIYLENAIDIWVKHQKEVVDGI